MNCSQMFRGAFTEKCAIRFIDYKNYNRYNNLKPFFKNANSGSKSYDSVGRRNENSFIREMKECIVPFLFGPLSLG